MRTSYCLPLLSLVLLCLTSCEEDTAVLATTSVIEPTGYPDVPQALWAYFERFEAEALERGLQVDLNDQDISAEISTIDDEGVAGTCTYGSHTPGHIVIDEQFWAQANANFREMIVFHELGHCSLFIGHREGSNANGTCLSIMRSGLDGCRDNYNNLTREGYLDELFLTP